ncbi:hypothetical protein BJ741DRAFT_665397 [Chytriomyces cf. hyalinus JEL632]|nr:hypothetical protein BJ741DRAFT_665397 [Chytriomyces cf. hyalinus JEL632]
MSLAAQEKETARIRSLAASDSPDFYSILGLVQSNSVTETDVKKAYRKLALLLHPDKCSVEGSDEAFKGVWYISKLSKHKTYAVFDESAISNAHSLLTDPVKRDHYDRYGVDPDSTAGKAFARPEGTGPAFVEGGFAESLNVNTTVKIFFPNSKACDIRFTAGPFYRRIFKNSPLESNFIKLEKLSFAPLPRWMHSAQLIPVALLCLQSLVYVALALCASIWGSHVNASVAKGAFSWDAGMAYTLERATFLNQVPYHVNPEMVSLHFSGANARKLLRFEKGIEKQHYRTLVYRCYLESEHKSQLLSQSHGFFSSIVNEEKLDVVNSFQMVSCNELKAWKSE